MADVEKKVTVRDTQGRPSLELTTETHREQGRAWPAVRIRSRRVAVSGHHITVRELEDAIAQLREDE